MRGIAELEEQGVVGSETSGRGHRGGNSGLSFVRECKCVICTVILQPLTVFPEMVSAVCSPMGVVEGAILSTPVHTEVFFKEPFCCCRFSVAPSPSLWSGKLSLKETNPEFQCRVSVGKRGLPPKPQNRVHSSHSSVQCLASI